MPAHGADFVLTPRLYLHMNFSRQVAGWPRSVSAALAHHPRALAREGWVAIFIDYMATGPASSPPEEQAA